MLSLFNTFLEVGLKKHRPLMTFRGLVALMTQHAAKETRRQAPGTNTYIMLTYLQ